MRKGQKQVKESVPTGALEPEFAAIVEAMRATLDAQELSDFAFTKGYADRLSRNTVERAERLYGHEREESG